VAAILVSGTDEAANPEASAMTTWLQERGVPSAHILTDVGGARTRTTMSRATRLFAVHGAIICTEALHMPRSLFLARENGIDAVGLRLPSPLDRSPRRIAVETLKTALAVVEQTMAAVL
jgi:vancomycin permeability regulator SanA